MISEEEKFIKNGGMKVMQNEVKRTRNGRMSKECGVIHNEDDVSEKFQK